jgi:hypothetical protein
LTLDPIALASVYGHPESGGSRTALRRRAYQQTKHLPDPQDLQRHLPSVLAQGDAWSGLQSAREYCIKEARRRWREEVDVQAMRKARALPKDVHGEDRLPRMS